MEVVSQWYDPSLVAIDERRLAQLPVGTIEAIAVDDNVLGTTPLSVGAAPQFMSQAEATIALGAINHMFWEQEGNTPDDAPFQRYEHQGAVGALAMTQAFEQAWADPNSPIRRARDQGIALDLADITAVFGNIPAPESRRDILNQILLSPRLPELAGVAHRLGRAHDPLGVEFAARLADQFPLGYGDEVLKKAQLTTSGLWRMARQEGSSSPCDVTAFADYQIPNVLRAMGLLSYEPSLAESIDQGALIPANGPQERAIRAAAVLAVDKLAAQQGVAVADVDYWLWLQRKVPTTPFHRTRTTLY
jgi:hypothetical protein